MDRRGFLQSVAGAIPGATLLGCGSGTDRRDGDAAAATLDPALLDAVAAVALPSALGAEGRTRAVTGFTRWLAGYQPVAEAVHGYGTGEIRYLPADPAPGWAAQLQALDIEARKRHGTGLAALDVERRRALVRAQLAQEGERLPATPERAHTVVGGLLAWYYRTPEATDLCYGARIGKETCRPLALSGARPEPLAPTRPT